MFASNCDIVEKIKLLHEIIIFSATFIFNLRMEYISVKSL